MLFATEKADENRMTADTAEVWFWETSGEAKKLNPSRSHMKALSHEENLKLPWFDPRSSKNKKG
jgi:hypothetical protein